MNSVESWMHLAHSEIASRQRNGGDGAAKNNMWCLLMIVKVLTLFLKLKQWSVNQTCHGWLHALTPTRPKEGLIPGRVHVQFTGLSQVSPFSLQKTPNSPPNSMWVSAGMHPVIHFILILWWFEICVEQEKSSSFCAFYTEMFIKMCRFVLFDISIK